MSEAAQARWPRNVFYGWWIAFAGAANNALLLGVTVFGFGVFIKPIRDELGWSLTALTIGFAIRSFQTGLLAPVVGILLERIGPRRMGVIGVVVASSGLVLMSQMHDQWMFYVSSVVVAVGTSMAGVTSYSAALVRWFHRSRGRAMGVLFSGNALGYGMAPVMAVLITQLGWRTAPLIAAVAILAAGVPLALVIRPRPEAYGLLPDGDTPAPASPPTLDGTASTPALSAIEDGFTVRETLRTPAFYLLMFAITVGAPTQSALIVFQVPALEHVGYSATGAALLAAGYGLFQAPVRLVIGGVADRFGRRRAYVCSFLLQAVGLAVFTGMDASRLWLVPLFYATYAVGHALFTILFLATIADYFGTRRYASLQGIIQMAQMPLGIALPILTGLVFDRTGTFTVIFLVYAAMVSLGAVSVFLVRRPTWGELRTSQATAVASASAVAVGD